MSRPKRSNELELELIAAQDRCLVGLHVRASDVLPRLRHRRLRQEGPRAVGWLAVVLLLLLGGNAIYRQRLGWVCGAADESGATTIRQSASAGCWVAAQTGEPKRLRSGGESQILLWAGARARVQGRSWRGPSLILENGTLELSVEEGRFTKYQVLAGPFHLTIPKGRVTANWNPMTLELELVAHEGYAVIAGCQFANGRSVIAGTRLRTRCIDP